MNCNSEGEDKNSGLWKCFLGRCVAGKLKLQFEWNGSKTTVERLEFTGVQFTIKTALQTWCKGWPREKMTCGRQTRMGLCSPGGGRRLHTERWAGRTRRQRRRVKGGCRDVLVLREQCALTGTVLVLHSLCPRIWIGNFLS